MAEWDGLETGAKRGRIVQDARNFIYAHDLMVDGRRFPFDCSGLVGAVLLKNGIDVFGGASELEIRGNGVRIVREFVGRYGTLYTMTPPGQGDLIFFSNTYDRDRDGLLNDDLTHIGIVEEVDSDGTVTFIHNVHHGVGRYVMNLDFPHQHRNAQGKIINSYLRKRRRSDRKNTPYLAGSLFENFGTLVREPAVARSASNLDSASRIH